LLAIGIEYPLVHSHGEPCNATRRDVHGVDGPGPANVAFASWTTVQFDASTSPALTFPEELVIGENLPETFIHPIPRVVLIHHCSVTDTDPL
jgi:hypothetical protein